MHSIIDFDKNLFHNFFFKLYLATMLYTIVTFKPIYILCLKFGSIATILYNILIYLKPLVFRKCKFETGAK